MFPAACLLGLFLAVVAPWACHAERSSLWLDIPFVKQEKNGCGAASAEMVIRYWKQQNTGQGIDAPPANDALRRVTPSQDGASGSDLSRHLRARGLRTFIFKAEWSDLRRHLSLGRPLIVCVRNPGGRVPHHYMVLAGLDERQGVVLVNDPARRKLLKLDQASFEKSWSAADHWTLLAVPDPH